MNAEQIVTCVAILVLCSFGIVALVTGHNGALVTGLAAAIGGLVGGRAAAKTIKKN